MTKKLSLDERLARACLRKFHRALDKAIEQHLKEQQHGR